MKLLQINPVIRQNTSTGRIMQEIAELATQHGWECYIAYSKGRDGMKPCKVKTVPVGDRWSTAWHGVMTRLLDRHGLASNNATRRFIKEIERIKPDIIHIHNIHGYFLNYKILFDYLSKAGFPVIWTVHDCWLYTGHCNHYSSFGCYKWEEGCHHCPQRKEFPTSYLIDRSTKNFQDKKKAFTSIPTDIFTIVTVSEWMKKEMSKSFFKDCRFQVIHNGINTQTFNIQDSSQIKRKYQIEDKHILLGVANIWNKEKGLYDFIELAKIIEEDEIIILVGIDDKQLSLLPHQIIAIKRTESIHELATLYSAAEVFINPTWQDNYPTVNMEAIACGTPVITYNTGGSVEVITEETGIIVDQGDIKGIKKGISTIRRKGIEFFQTHCRRYALTHFKKDDRYADYLKLYKELTNNTKNK